MLNSSLVADEVTLCIYTPLDIDAVDVRYEISLVVMSVVAIAEFNAV